MVVECSIWLGSVVYGCKVYYMVHWDFKVSRFQTKVYENFANYFLKTKANNKCLIVLKCRRKGLQKSISELERYTKPKALRQFKVDPVLKIDETVYKHPESMWVVEFSIWLRSVVYGCGV